MDDHYPTISEPATADYVLSVLRDEHRQQCHYDDAADPDISLSFETTVAEWSEACDLVGWRELGRGLNLMWGIARSDAEWRAVLEPSHRRRLRDVCDLIARHATRRRIRPARLLGSDCASAGVFLTIRSLLRQEGADVDDMAPSTPLAEYTRRHVNLFLGPISRLAPACLPAVRIHKPIYDIAVWGTIAAMLLTGVGSGSGLHLLTLVGVPLIGLCHMLTEIAAKRIPASVQFGDLRTFRDLALAMSRSEAA
jgi:hypothetical protein